MSTDGSLKEPVTLIVSPVKESVSIPTRLKEADELVADVFCRLYGDTLAGAPGAASSGVHTCPAAASAISHSADPSIPEKISVIVIVIFDATANVIKGWSSGVSVSSGGFVMGRMVPVVPFKAAKPPTEGCTVNVLPVNTILPGVATEELILASPVKFSTPVIRLA
jgi:hypothetical protein